MKYLIIVILITFSIQSNDFTDELTLMSRDISIGNGWTTNEFGYVFSNNDVDLNNRVLELNCTELKIFGVLRNNGVEVTVVDMVNLGLIKFVRTVPDSDGNYDRIVFDN